MNQISRRAALRIAAAGAALVPLLSSGDAYAAATGRLYRRSRFRRQRGKRFRVVGGLGRPWSPRLTSVERLPGARRRDEGCFVLIFTSGRSGPPQGTYRFRRRGFTATELFVVPSDADRRTYVAIVNRS